MFFFFFVQKYAHISLKNIVDPDLTPLFATSKLILHWLPNMCILSGTRHKWVKINLLMRLCSKELVEYALYCTCQNLWLC